jgi:hypothetical protein
VDSGATGNFIDWDYIRSNRLTTRRLSKPVPVYNVDDTLNEAGSITEVADLILRYKNHSERTLFAVTGLGKQNLLLGHTWLLKHNPEIDWATGEVKMSRCSARCCSGCRDEIREEFRAQKAEIRRIAKLGHCQPMWKTPMTKRTSQLSLEMLKVIPVMKSRTLDLRKETDYSRPV